MSIDFFKSLKDEDFFSNKLNHIYLNTSINEESVNKLIYDINKINKLDNPTPILIHIACDGGEINEGYRLLSIFDTSKVPIATIIDNYSFSAATFLSITCPYRLMTKEAFCLLHDYSVTFKQEITVNKTDVFNLTTHFDSYFNNIIDIYLKKTSIKREELVELLQHDIYLDYKDCLSKNIVHRVIDCEYKPTFSLKKINDIKNIVKLPNVISIKLNPCYEYSSNINYTIMNNNDGNKHFIVYPQYYSKNTCRNDIQPTIFNHFNLISKVKYMNGDKIAIIDNPISIDNLLPLLFTHKIYMYHHTYIICNMLYLYNLKPSILLDDIIKNNKKLFKFIKNILLSKTKMSKQQIDDINKKYSIISSQEAKKLHLCHEIIHLS
jgi:ATP-dependent protease ClpP protease subunit